MKKTLIVVCCAILCILVFLVIYLQKQNSSSNDTLSSKTTNESLQKTTRVVLNEEKSVLIDTINTITKSKEGFVSLDDADFMKKAYLVSTDTTYKDLVEIFGETPGAFDELNIINYYYYSENYYFRVTPFFVTLVEISRPDIVIVIDQSQ